MATSTTPGVYIEEISNLLPAIASAETAIPAFIGYTQIAKQQQTGDLDLIPKKISSILEYEQFFGFPDMEKTIEVSINSRPGNTTTTAKIKNPSPYLMYYGLQLFFGNGGGPCYIVSVGNYSGGDLISAADLQKGLDAIAKTDEITLILFPDSIHLPGPAHYYGLYKQAMVQCALLKDRFTILDVWIDKNTTTDNIKTLRDFDMGPMENRKYGAAYYPRIYTSLDYAYDDSQVAIIARGNISLTGTLAALRSKNNSFYLAAKKTIADILMLLPVSCAVAGVYAQMDNTRGVWKAPANVNIVYAVKPGINITTEQQDKLNVDASTGKSINAIRNFPGRGPAIIWGARTLAGNDNEWRYISVRRFFNMVEESVKKGTEPFVFEPNDANTWVKVRAMIENYLVLQWRQGALAGTKPSDAFYVRVGLGQTMTQQDLLEGRMIVEIGMAVVRPAEFIILSFSHKMMNS